jgi:hypothetical protein
VGQQTHERYVLDAVYRDAARGTLAATFDSRELMVREEIVDPFVVGSCRMSRNINVVQSGHFYPGIIGYYQ